MHLKSCKTLDKWWSDNWTPPACLNPWQWAEGHLELSARATAYPGKYRTRHTPYIKRPLEDFQDPAIRRITLCFSAQSAKTTALLVMLAYAIDQDPGPVLLVQSSMDAARSFSKNRLQPLIEDCPCLARHKSGNRFDFNSTEMILDRLSIYLQGAGSPSQLASRPIKYLLADEVDKWPDQSKREADALSLALERVKSYRSHKIILASTPTIETAPIWTNFKAGSQCRFYVPCPHCGSLFVMSWPLLKWTKSDHLEEVKASVYLECPHCQGHITERDKAGLLSKGSWIAENEDAPANHRSYHLNEIYSPWTRWGDLVGKFLLAKAEAKTGATGSLHNFINSSLAEPWIEDEHVKRRSAHDLQRLCDNRQPGEIPDDGVIALTMGADTQDDGFWYVVRAWGRDLESWLIREGFCPDLETLRTIASESRYLDSKGNQYAVSRAFIDSGGHRTGEIYELARRHPLFVPIKGEIRLAGRPWSVSVLDSIPKRDGKKYPVPGGLQLMRLDVTYYKDLLAGKLNLEPGSPGRFRLHAEVSGDYLAQMTAEYKDEKGHWQCPGHKANHLWDCEVYCLAAADIQGIRFINRSVNNEQKKQKPQKKRRPSTKWW